MKFKFVGKLPADVLQNIVFKYTGLKRKDVLLGPSIGEDAAVLKINRGNSLIVSADPITGAIKNIGWLAVNICANDVATRGVRPRWFSCCILLPEKSSENALRRVCRQIDKAAKSLRVAVVGGHSEVTPGLKNPVVVGYMAGIAKGGNYVTCANAKPGDKIILTKGAGIEGTSILASDRRKVVEKVYGRDFVERAMNYINAISVVKDALTAFGTGGVNAMHDPTEGGIAGGLHEIGDAANVGFCVYEEQILVNEETRKLCSLFRIDPLKLISSGSLLISAKREKAEDIVKSLKRAGIQARVIGDVLKSPSDRYIITRKKRKVKLERPEMDHLWIALRRRIRMSK